MTPRPLPELAVSAARWPPAAALVALLAFGAIVPEKYGFLPDWASGPLWFLVLSLIVLSTFAHASALLRRLEEPLTTGLLLLVTGIVVFDVIRLIELVLGEATEVRAVPLLSTAVTLWLSNVVIFSLWYWHLDRGGPERRLRGVPLAADLVFARASDATEPDWTPQFLDYVFVAFNTSTAFSPTDTSPGTARGKLLMMGQAVISLLTLALAVARAVNILK